LRTMCGRYATTRSEADLSDLFEALDVTEGLGPSWNVAPTDPVPIVRVSLSHDARVLDKARWGLVPPWAADTRGAARMINARSETVATSPAFAPSFARRRCLVPADGWFEWLRDGKQKQAYYMTPADGSPLAFAGIWSPWGPESLLTCSVLTTAALGGLARVHDRMPLILPRERWSGWLAGSGDPAELLQPMTADELARSETIPKVCIVGPPVNGGHISTRYFTPQEGHATMAVTGGCCLAAACLMPGTVAHEIAQGLPSLGIEASEIQVDIENPAGILSATIGGRHANGTTTIDRAAYKRSAQVLLRGYAPLYRASPELKKALAEIAANPALAMSA